MWVIDFVVYQWAKTKHKRSGLEWISWIVLAGCIVKCHFVGIIIFHCQRIVLSWWRICLNGNLACSSLRYGFCDASGKLLISFQGSYITLPVSLTLSCLFLERRHVALGSCHKKRSCLIIMHLIWTLTDQNSYERALLIASQICTLSLWG